MLESIIKMAAHCAIVLLVVAVSAAVAHSAAQPAWGLSASRRAYFPGHGPQLSTAPADQAAPTARWFAGQTVDHFVPAAERTTWSQRYYVNDTLWGGPSSGSGGIWPFRNRDAETLIESGMIWSG